MEKKEVSEKLLDLFNLTLSCNDSCPLEKAKAQSCVHDELEGEFTLNFELELYSKDKMIMESDSFVLLKEFQNSKLCQLEYTGPNLIIFDEEKDCVTNIQIF